MPLDVSCYTRFEVILRCEADLIFQISSGVFTLCNNEHNDYFEPDDIRFRKVWFIVKLYGEH
jgi:hypothetical protein